MALLLMGACFYTTARVSTGREDSGMWGVLVGLALTPVATAALVLELPRPRNGLARVVIALGLGAAVLAVMLAI